MNSYPMSGERLSNGISSLRKLLEVSEVRYLPYPGLGLCLAMDTFVDVNFLIIDIGLD